MATLTEAQIVNAIAKHERSIDGIQNSFPYAENPDAIMGKLPCVIHYSPGFTSETRAHHNVWTNTVQMRSVLFVAERASKGGALKYLENDALRYGYLWRHKFQTEDVISDLFASTSNTVRVFLQSGEYGAGGQFLTFAGVPYIGWVFNWSFKEN
jgi:hypothetical protein